MINSAMITPITVNGKDSSILISKGLAATVIGGLISSTLLTLVVVPVIYEILFTLKKRFTKR
ncbi:hypothetical protein ACVQ92_08955 [Staphylococcus aureus]